MAAALRKLRTMSLVMPQEVAVGEELARRWDAAKAAAKVPTDEGQTSA